MPAEQTEFLNLIIPRSKDFKIIAGLDPDPKRMPPFYVEAFKYDEKGHLTDAAPLVDYLVELITPVADEILATKPQLAFYEALGPEAVKGLGQFNSYMEDQFPDVGRLADAKRGDIDNTMGAYAISLVNLGFQASTVNPYLGLSEYRPFHEAGLATIGLCLTSNKGNENQRVLVNLPRSVENNSVTAHERDTLMGIFEDDHVEYHLLIAQRHEDLENPNRGIVVGATYASSLENIRKVFSGFILAPGVGRQGGDLEETLRLGSVYLGPNPNDYGNIGVNVSSGFMYASKERDFASASRDYIRGLNQAANRVFGK